MATREELRAALDDYVTQATRSARVLKALRNWSCVIFIEATDLDARFTMTVRDAAVEIRDEVPTSFDLMVAGASDDLTDIFWCDANPAGSYMQGAIQVRGSSDDQMRLDAMALMIYLEVQGSAG